MKLARMVDLLVEARVGAPGSTIFTNFMPSECTRGVLLRNNLGGVEIYHELPGYYQSEPQAIVRAQTIEDGESLAESVMAALTVHQTRTLQDSTGRDVMQLNYLRPKHEPIVFPRSDGNGREWSINFSACYVVLT